MRFSFLILSFIFGCIKLQADWWQMSTNMQATTTAITVRPYSGTDSAVPVYMVWLYATTDPSYQGSNTVTVPIVSSITFQGGTTYYAWIKAYDYQDHQCGLTIGDASSTNTVTMNNDDFNRHWTGPFTLTPSATSTNFSATFYRTNYPATDNTVKYLFKGVYVTTNAYEDIAFEGQDLVQIFKPPTSLVTNVVAGNLILNSGFELGPNAHGWGGLGQTTEGRTVLCSDMWDSTTSAHGKYSLKLSEKSEWYSTIFQVDRPNQTFTLSFYAKVDPSYTNAVYGGDGAKMLANINNALTAPTTKQSVTNYSTQFVLTTNWTRYSTQVTLWNYPTNWFQIDFASGNKFGATILTIPTIWIDSVQLEEGNTATTYSQKNSVEIGIGIVPLAHTFHSGDTREFKVYSYNKTLNSITNTFSYEVRDLANILELSDSPTLIFPVGNGTNTISLSGVTKFGVHRILGRIDSDEDETSYSYLVTDGSTNKSPTDWIGTHANGNTAMAQIHRERWGLSNDRGLSPLSIFRWASSEAVQGTYVWPTNRVISSSTNGMDILATMSSNFEWPSWATITLNGQSCPDPTYFSNWVYQAVSFGKPYIGSWEMWNENQYVFNAANQLIITKNFIGAVYAADPTAKIIIGGGETDSSRAYAVWSGLTAGEKSKVTAFSVHIYPDSSGIPTMGPHSETRYAPFKAAFTTELSNFYNSESGPQDTGGFLKGKNSTFKLFGDYYNQFGRSARYFNIFNNVDQQYYVMIRAVGLGWKYFSYDSRNTSSNPGLLDTTHTGFEHFDAMHPKLYAMAFVNQLLKGFTPVGVKYTNSANSYMEGYAFSNGGTNLLCILNADYTNRFLTLSQTNFSQMNAEGNDVTRANLARVDLTRRPIWLKSTVLTTNQLTSAFTGATITNTVDSVAPNISIDVSPYGLITDNQVNLMFRWFAQDDTYLSGDLYPTNIVYRHRLVGYNDWQSWSGETMVQYNNLNGGINYHLEVESRDLAGNTGTANGPVFFLDSKPQLKPNWSSGKINVRLTQ